MSNAPEAITMNGHFEARRWFDGESTYFSLRLHYVDEAGYPSVRVLAECDYGYGDQWTTVAVAALGLEYANQFRRLGYTESVVDVPRKRDL
jgi:hypothetical protein